MTMKVSSEELVQTIFQKCAGTSGCEVCRPHMHEDCLFFPELYRLQDEFVDKGNPLDSKSVGKLIDLCTLFGLCPCPDVRMLILKTKADHADEKGLPLSSKLIADAQRAGKLGGMLNNAANFISNNSVTSPFLQKVLKIHTDRKLPGFPKQSFFSWAREKGLHIPNRYFTQASQKVVYFTGCSAGYFFPEVGKSTVSLLEKIGVEVFVPEQACCSMPLLMEGQKQKAMEKIAKLGVKPADVSLIINTHTHCDHIGANRIIHEQSGCDIALHTVGRHFIETKNDWATWWRYYNQEADFFECTRPLEDGDVLKIGLHEIQVIYTPGHASDGIVLYNREQKLLISSDNLWENDMAVMTLWVEGSLALF